MFQLTVRYSTIPELPHHRDTLDAKWTRMRYEGADWLDQIMLRFSPIVPLTTRLQYSSWRTLTMPIGIPTSLTIRSREWRIRSRWLLTSDPKEKEEEASQSIFIIYIKHLIIAGVSKSAATVATTERKTPISSLRRLTWVTYNFTEDLIVNSEDERDCGQAVWIIVLDWIQTERY